MVGRRRANTVQDALAQEISASSQSPPLLDNNGDPPTDCFFIADMGEVRRQYQIWKQHMNAVQPFYAVKCNPDPNLLRFLASLSSTIGFDCASISEIQQVLSLGVSPSRIIFASPVKTRSAIEFAKLNKVACMTFDNSDELRKIAEHYPEAHLYLRIVANDSTCAIDLSAKYGADVGTTRDLLSTARDLGLQVKGIAFHVGTGVKEGTGYAAAISQCKNVLQEAEEFGFEIDTIDIGGGFGHETFEKVSEVVSASLDTLPLGLRIIAEPGRFFAATAYTLACQVVGVRHNNSKKDAPFGERELDRLYLSDGVFGNFMNVLVEKLDPEAYLIKSPTRRCISNGHHSGSYQYSLWGPTCDSTDKITDACSFPEEVQTDDWICFPEMGAYTSTCATSFNGFPSARKTIYVDSGVGSIDST